MTGWLKSIKQFYLVLSLQSRQAMHHKTAAVAVIVSWGLRMGMTILLYHGIYRVMGKEDIKGLSFSVASSSMLLYALYSGFGSREMFKQINNEYKSGLIEVWVNKPVSYCLMKMADVLGRNIPVVCGLAICVCLYWGAFGLPTLNEISMRFICGLALLVMGVVIGYLIYTLVGLSVIWLKDATGTWLIVDKLVMIFGGAYIPIAFFPPWLRYAGEMLPTTAMTYITQVFYPDFFDHLPRFISTQIFWILLLVAAINRVNKLMNRHLLVNGG